MRPYRTGYRLWGVMAFAAWGAYLAFDHFTNDGHGVIFYAIDLIGALSEGQRIRALVPNARAFFIVPFLKSVAVALVLGWVVHAMAVALGFRLGRAPDQAAEYDDKPPDQ